MVAALRDRLVSRKYSPMTIEGDTAKLLAFINFHGIDGRITMPP